MKEADLIVALFSEQRRECVRNRTALECWLGVLTPIRWLMSGGAIFLSAFAGLSVMGQSEFFGDNWHIVSGISAFSAALLTGLHAGYKCDEHQAECFRLIRAYTALETEYQSAITIRSLRGLVAKRDELTSKLSELKEKAAASPTKWCRRRAEVKFPVED